METFLGLHGPDCGRIFPVWMSPTPNLAPVFESLLKYKLWYEDEAGRPRTRWFPEIDPTDRAYGRIQQDMARRLAEIPGASTPAPRRADPAVQVPRGPANGSAPLVLVNGGEDDADLVLEVARRLHADHGLGSFVPISALPDRQGYRSSEITRDLRDKLKLANAVLVVFRDGPTGQIHEQFREYLRHSLRLGGDRTAPSLDLCQARHDVDLGLHPAQLRVHFVNGDCAGDCARRLAGALAP